MAKLEDLLSLAVDKNPTEFQAALDEILGAKAIEALEARRIEIASSLYSEDVEQIDELSKETLGNYVKKASRSAGSDNFTAGYHSARDGTYGSRTNSKDEFKHLNKADKRQKNIDKAIDKMTKEEVEDVEQIDELSKETLGNYVKKAGSSYDDNRAKANEVPRNPKTKEDKEKVQDSTLKMKNRVKGIFRAKNRLGEEVEDVEQIDEATKFQPHEFFHRVVKDLRGDVKELKKDGAHEEAAESTWAAGVIHKAAKAAEKGDHKTVAKHLNTMSGDWVDSLLDHAHDSGHSSHLAKYYDKHGIKGI